MSEAKIAVVVSGCDKYAYLRDIQIQLFAKYWPNCPYTIYLISETTEFKYDINGLDIANVNVTLSSGNNGPSDWSQMLYMALTCIDADYILYLQDDYIFTEPVDVEGFKAIVDYAVAQNINYVRFRTSPPGTGPKISITDTVAIREIEPGAMWQCSLMAALWKKSTLKSLVAQARISAWQFELERHDHLEKFYCIDAPLEVSKVIPFLGAYGSSNGFGIYPEIQEFLKREGMTMLDGSPINYDIRF